MPIEWAVLYSKDRDKYVSCYLTNRGELEYDDEGNPRVAYTEDFHKAWLIEYLHALKLCELIEGTDAILINPESLEDKEVIEIDEQGELI